MFLVNFRYFVQYGSLTPCDHCNCVSAGKSVLCWETLFDSILFHFSKFPRKMMLSTITYTYSQSHRRLRSKTVLTFFFDCLFVKRDTVYKVHNIGIINIIVEQRILLKYKILCIPFTKVQHHFQMNDKWWCSESSGKAGPLFHMLWCLSCWNREPATFSGPNI